jgi:hypothetical protein
LDNVDLSGGGNLAVDSGQTLTLAGNVTLDDVVLSGDVSNDAIIVDGNHTLTLDAASISGGNITDTDTIEVSGNSTLDNVDLSGGGNLTVDGGKTLTLDHASIDGSTIDLGSGAGGAEQTVTEISVSNLNAIGPSMSTDGTYVAFIASPDLPGQGSDLGNSVIELYDAGNGQLTEISADAPPLPDGETSAGFSNIPSISADGRYVVFDEKFLIANDQGPPIDASEVLLYDGQSQTVTVVQNFAGHAAISGNGQYIVMQADPPPDSNNNSNGKSLPAIPISCRRATRTILAVRVRSTTRLSAAMGVSSRSGPRRRKSLSMAQSSRRTIVPVTPRFTSTTARMMSCRRSRSASRASPETANARKPRQRLALVAQRRRSLCGVPEHGVQSGRWGWRRERRVEHLPVRHANAYDPDCLHRARRRRGEWRELSSGDQC